jgi:hypothetical protein
MNEIEQLLELQTNLADIAYELYGEDWISSDKFWGSVTEKQMALVTNQMFDLGFEHEPSEDEVKMAMSLKGKYKRGRN